MSIREVLLKAKWKGLKNVTIKVLDRLSSKGYRTIKLEDVKEIAKGHLTYGDKETYIPYHRILEIKTGKKALFKRSNS